MTASFPLFEQLYHQTTEESPFSEGKKMELCRKIKFLDEDGHEMIFLLILCYSRIIEHSNDPLPYQPKIGKLGYRFETNELPLRLLGIMDKFIQLHYKKMEDERHRFEKKKENG